jgi:S-DNA-T family DNA segregation ATPase FtsK/SpoIIIE
VLAVAIALPLPARLGRPADRPITDRVSQGKACRKLTAELVRCAFLSVQFQGINSAVAKDPNALSFPVEIHRDGPGHLAIVDLPYGVEASNVIGRRGRLASGLRLALDQLWPEPAPGHRSTGPVGRARTGLADAAAGMAAAQRWCGGCLPAVSVRHHAPPDTVNAELMYRNWLFGGQPGSGKTFALRLLVLAAALLVFVDEIQDLFLHKQFKKQVRDIPEKVIKLGRALGVILVVGTQIPDKDSLPTGITRNIDRRCCLSVADQTANDMILGT